MIKKLSLEEMILNNNHAISEIAQINESLIKSLAEKETIARTTFEMILANNEALTMILQVNETLYNQLEEEGLDVPREKRLIKFPKGYIKTLEKCKEEYHLAEIIRDADMVKKVAYCIEVGDLYQYMTERFYVFGSIENMVHMQWYICKISAIEAMIIMSARHLGISEAILSQKREVTLRRILNNEEYRNIVKLTKERADQLHELFSRRNNIHLVPLGNEEKTLKFGLEDVEEVETVLKDIAELLYNALKEQDNLQ